VLARKLLAYATGHGVLSRLARSPRLVRRLCLLDLALLKEKGGMCQRHSHPGAARGCKVAADSRRRHPEQPRYLSLYVPPFRQADEQLDYPRLAQGSVLSSAGIVASTTSCSTPDPQQRGENSREYDGHARHAKQVRRLWRVTDCEKYNSDVLLGWRVHRFTPSQICSVYALGTLQEHFEARY
jgi:hypothetical protein